MCSIKEPLFFCSYGVDEAELENELYPCPLEKVVRDLDAYQQLYADAGSARALGEASVYYLLDYEKTIANIKKLVPNWNDLKIIILLRNPVNASLSNYSMYSLYLRYFLKNKQIPSFEESFDLEQQRLEEGKRALAHFHWFRYYQQVKAYQENFKHVRIYLNTDLQQRRDEVLRDIYDFLEVDPGFVPENLAQEYNVSGVPKVGVIYRLLMVPAKLKVFLRPIVRIFISRERQEAIVNRLLRHNFSKAEVSADMREKLVEYYRDDVLKLQDLIGRDLSAWTR
jgi:hypothetical protein